MCSESIPKELTTCTDSTCTCTGNLYSFPNSSRSRALALPTSPTSEPLALRRLRRRRPWMVAARHVAGTQIAGLHTILASMQCTHDAEPQARRKTQSTPKQLPNSIPARQVQAPARYLERNTGIHIRCLLNFANELLVCKLWMCSSVRFMKA